MNYEIEYLKRILQLENIEPPDRKATNGHGEVLTSLYEAHKRGGASAARTAWETVKRLRPDLAHLENFRQNWLYADDLKNLAIPVYNIPDYPIYAKGLNALVGSSGAGKSFIALDISAKIAMLAPVLYIAAEGLYGYSSRWEAWKLHYRVKENRNLIFYEKSINLFAPEIVATFINEVKNDICPDGVEMIIVDTVARCMVGGDENSTRDMGLFVDHCDIIRRELNTGILLVHHTGKDGKMRGSTALPGSVDSTIFLKREDRQIVLFNSHEHGGKNKYSEEAPPMWMELLPTSVEIQGEIVNSAVAVKSERVLPQTTQDKLSTNQKMILEALDGYESGLAGASLIDATEIKKSTLYKTIQKLMKLEYVIQQEDKYLITESGIEALNA
jgi:predicted transcriptional regulator